MKKLSLILLCCIFFSSCGTQYIEKEKLIPQNNIVENVVEEKSVLDKTEEKVSLSKENNSQIKKDKAQSNENPLETEEKETPFANENSQQNNNQDIKQNDEETPVIQEATTKTITVRIIGMDEFTIEKNIDFSEGMTVLEATLLATQDTSYSVDYSGTKSTAYIKGIGNLYEKQHGAISGWCYYVNDVMINKSSGRCVIETGDIIKWEYCTDYKQ